ncbi:hypothetical protein FA95DRAFT_696875 [Auriscalpium vulgare]|uniref:Uncharacterized protein n=1 Tax=Auriscalpium vulgare TaxID=40419 RepID=A0ACB8RCS1_9AGAM|nr:hypothetical protein FA95DRAFT_696875 [Auriscalpium vulgare]
MSQFSTYSMLPSTRPLTHGRQRTTRANPRGLYASFCACSSPSSSAIPAPAPGTKTEAACGPTDARSLNASFGDGMSSAFTPARNPHGLYTSFGAVSSAFAPARNPDGLYTSFGAVSSAFAPGGTTDARYPRGRYASFGACSSTFAPAPAPAPALTATDARRAVAPGDARTKSSERRNVLRAREAAVGELNVTAVADGVKRASEMRVLSVNVCGGAGDEGVRGPTGLSSVEREASTSGASENWPEMSAVEEEGVEGESGVGSWKTPSGREVGPGVTVVAGALPFAFGLGSAATGGTGRAPRGSMACHEPGRIGGADASTSASSWSAAAVVSSARRRPAASATYASAETTTCTKPVGSSAPRASEDDTDTDDGAGGGTLRVVGASGASGGIWVWLASGALGVSDTGVPAPSGAAETERTGASSCCTGSTCTAGPAGSTSGRSSARYGYCESTASVRPDASPRACARKSGAWSSACMMWPVCATVSITKTTSEKRGEDARRAMCTRAAGRARCAGARARRAHLRPRGGARNRLRLRLQLWGRDARTARARRARDSRCAARGARRARLPRARRARRAAARSARAGRQGTPAHTRVVWGTARGRRAGARCGRARWAARPGTTCACGQRGRGRRRGWWWWWWLEGAGCQNA